MAAETPKVFKFSQVAVFGHIALQGNPLAVVHSATDLTAEQMQRFAQWTNLSETTFLLPPTHPDADYRVRIFTPNEEFDFAGHPTLGSAHAWLEAGGQPKDPAWVIQECGVGLVRLRTDDLTRAATRNIAFEAPPLRRAGEIDAETLARVIKVLGVSADQVLASNWIGNGPGWLGVLLTDAQTVLDLTPDFSAMGDLCISVIGAHSSDEHAPENETGSGNKHAPGNEHAPDYEVRAFIPDTGINEDPVTGSANAGLAQWLIGAGLAPAQYTARQGTAIGYDGRISLLSDDSSIWVGGSCVTVVSGAVAL